MQGSEYVSGDFCVQLKEDECDPECINVVVRRHLSCWYVPDIKSWRVSTRPFSLWNPFRLFAYDSDDLTQTLEEGCELADSLAGVSKENLAILKYAISRMKDREQIRKLIEA